MTDEQRRTLQRCARGRTTPARLMRRAQTLLRAAEGQENIRVAAELGVRRTIVGRWRCRFAEHSLAGVDKDGSRGDRKPIVREQVARRILEVATQPRPANATPWSTNSLAKHRGVSPSMVWRVWRANGLKPHWARTFKVSNDPQFVEKVIDIVGLYLNPPENAPVYRVDEKSQIQALAGAASAVPPALHVDQQFVAQPGRARVSRHHGPAHPSGRFRSVKELGAVIQAYIAKHNADPQALVWTAKTEAILEKVRHDRLAGRTPALTRTGPRTTMSARPSTRRSTGLCHRTPGYGNPRRSAPASRRCFNS